MIAINSRLDFGKYLAEKNMLGAAAEIGVAAGDYSLSILGWGITTLYLVDLWKHVPNIKGSLGLDQQTHDEAYNAMLARLKDHMDRVVILRGWSHQECDKVPDGSLDFFHLDSTHEAEDQNLPDGVVPGTLRELDCWWPKLKPGGIASGHDYLASEYTVKRAADEFAARRGLDLKITDRDRPEHACFWFEKP